MIADKKEFGMGVALFVGFGAVFVAMFMPLFGGQNFLNYMDNLYNSISKASAYYVPGLREANETYRGRAVQMSLQYGTERQAEQAAALFRGAGAAAEGSGAEIRVGGDLGAILESALKDTDAMFHNNDQELEARYGYPGRQALYAWWMSLNDMDRVLKKQKQFDNAKFVAQVNQRGVECAYNYFGVEPQSIGQKAWIVVFSLVFYVIYTLWFGFSILFMFEGWGLKLEH